MSHGPKKQSTGSQKAHRDRHQTKVPKGPRETPKNHGKGDSYKAPKHRGK